MSRVKRPILQYDVRGNLIGSFESIRAASKSSGVMACNISRAVNRKNRKAVKYTWRYAEYVAPITYEMILKMFNDKEILDRFDKPTLSIASKTRKRDYVDLRMTFYRLCYLYCDSFTQDSCANFIGQDHAIVSGALKKWNYISKSEDYIYLDLYKDFDEILSNKKSETIKPKSIEINYNQMSKPNLIAIILELKKQVELEDIEVEYEEVGSEQKDLVYSYKL